MKAQSLFLEYLQSHFSDNYDDLKQKFKTYATLLERESKLYNLTAIAPEEYEEKHFLDCLLLGESFAFQSETLIDVGSGAGFPGLVLAIAFKDLKVTLLEPTKKRCGFLELVVQSLGLTNVTVINKRAEDCSEMRETFDIATSRAVAFLPVLLELCVPLVKIGGTLLVMKGKNFDEELISAKQAMTLLQLEVGATVNHFLPSDGSIRTNISFIKKAATNSKYPRSFAQIKKTPL